MVPSAALKTKTRDAAYADSRSYAGVMVSTSLGSDASFRMPSPTRTASKLPPRQTSRQQTPPSPDPSLDDLIDKFRASASSLTFSTARSDRETARPSSPAKKGDPMRLATAQTPKKKSVLKRQVTPREVVSSSSDGEPVGVSPMPKLTYVPKPKPSLAIAAPTKPTDAGSLAPRSFHSTNDGISREPSARSRLASPKKTARKPTPDQRREPASPLIATSTSDQSTRSSFMEDIDAPDFDPGEESIDKLISHDLRRLHRMVSSSHDKSPPEAGRLSHSLTTEDIAREFQQSTRFCVADTSGSSAGTSPRVSPFRLFSPRGRSSSASPFQFEPVQSLLHRRHHDYEQADEHEDSFTEELRVMRASAMKEKKASADAANKKHEDEKKKKEAEAPGAKIASLREAVDMIDKNLLLALRPFDKMKQELDKEDAKAAAGEERADEALVLPMATQAIVERLEQAFGGQTRQRETELKAEEDAAAASKAQEEEKQKAEDAKKAAEEATRKQHESEILSLIPLRGRLLCSENDVDDALLRLEIAENMAGAASWHRQPIATEPSALILENQLEELRDRTQRRVREIEGALVPKPTQNRRGINWDRDAFPVDEAEDTASSNEDSSGAGEGDVSFLDVLQTEVLEKLDFTILKLKHALSIDQKEAEEARNARKRAEEDVSARRKKEAQELEQKMKAEEDAVAARGRVMGVSSLEELTYVTEVDTRLRESLHHDRAIQRLEDALDTPILELNNDLLPFFDNSRAGERFDQVKLMMETPNILHRFQHSEWPKIERYGASALDQAIVSQSHIPRVQLNNQPRGHAESGFHHAYRNREFASPTRRQRRERQHGAPQENNKFELQQKSIQNKAQARSLPSWRQVTSPTVRPRQSHDKLRGMKQAIHDMQVNRREKTQWLHSSTRLA